MEHCTPAELNQVAKTQWVRVADVFLIGPLMMAGGVALGRRGSPLWGTLLALFGASTVLYNGRNWLRVRRGAS